MRPVATPPSGGVPALRSYSFSDVEIASDLLPADRIRAVGGLSPELWSSGKNPRKPLPWLGLASGGLYKLNDFLKVFIINIDKNYLQYKNNMLFL